MYVVRIDTGSGKLISLEMVPMQIKHFKVNNASQPDVEWMRKLLEREEKEFGCSVEMKGDNILSLSSN